MADYGQAKTMEDWRRWHGVSDRGAYVPSPAEIEKQKEVIQAFWSDAERKKRAVIQEAEEVSLPTISTALRHGSEYLTPRGD